MGGGKCMEGKKAWEVGRHCGKVWEEGRLTITIASADEKNILVSHLWFFSPEDQLPNDILRMTGAKLRGPFLIIIVYLPCFVGSVCTTQFQENNECVLFDSSCCCSSIQLRFITHSSPSHLYPLNDDNTGLVSKTEMLHIQVVLKFSKCGFY